MPESDARSVRPGLPVPNKPYGFRGRKVTVNNEMLRKGSLFPYYINTNFPCGPFFTYCTSVINVPRFTQLSGSNSLITLWKIGSLN